MNPTKKIILITGASSGIGKNAALQLIKLGHIVYGAARRIDKMQDLVLAGGQAVALDITDEVAIQNVVDSILKKHGRIDVLVNNAGYGLYGSVEEISLEQARYQFDVNIFGLAAITKAVIPSMREHKFGRIINISSVGGKIYTPLGAWYHATKHALEGWSDSLRLELAPFGVAVSIIEPGGIATEFGDVLYEPMLKISGNGPYKKLALAVAKFTKENYEKKGAASPASVIGDCIVKAVSAKKSKTRYVAGMYAKPLLFIRKYFSDSMFDKILMSQIK